MAQIDTIIHQPVRLRIMACLVALRPQEKVDFTYLKKMLDATDGNLGAHIIKLEDAGYIVAEKTFVGRKPKTFLSATTRGKSAFAEHVAALEGIIGESMRPWK
jgi:DNA-binding MarR family transcriptional regulator